MSASGNLDTSTTLLRRLRQTPPNEHAWNTFVDRYGRLIFGWARHWGLSPEDAEDLTQNVLLDLARQMGDFRYDPRLRFRGWLHTLTFRKWRRFLLDRKRTQTGSDDSALENASTPEAHKDFLARLQVDSERELLFLAKEKVRIRVQAKTWDAFRLTALENFSGADAASRLGMKVGAVFVARSKVQRMIQDEYHQLLDESD
jgi:RNA polymerase sigma-70 factor (ECF subfamily)